MQTESQMLVKIFAEKHNHKFIGKMFGVQIGCAKRLLNDYSYDDVALVIEYTALFPKKRIVSLAYYSYIMEETLVTAKAWKLREEQKKVTEFTNEKLIKTENKSLSNKKVFKKGVF